MIRLIKMLCPKRHCITAVAYDPAEIAPAEALKAFKEVTEVIFTEGHVNRSCGICDSRSLRCEDGATRYATLEEARKELGELEAGKLAARVYYANERERSMRN